MGEDVIDKPRRVLCVEGLAAGAQGRHYVVDERSPVHELLLVAQVIPHCAHAFENLHKAKAPIEKDLSLSRVLSNDQALSCRFGRETAAYDEVSTLMASSVMHAGDLNLSTLPLGLLHYLK